MTILKPVYKKIKQNWNGHFPENLPLRSKAREIALAAQANLEAWQSPQVHRERSLFQIIDFFSGAGGMSLGFAALSVQNPFFEIVGGLDIDKDACNTFNLNFGVPGYRKDIRDLLDPDELDSFTKSLGNYDPKKPTVVIGCPPCQGFSSHRKKAWDKEDRRNSLAGIFAQVAVNLNPVAIVIENVPEMLSTRYWGHFELANEILENRGYVVKQTIVNSAHFGVPQERFRAVLMALKKDFALPQPLVENPLEFMTVRQAIGDLPKIDPGERLDEDPLHRCANHRASTVKTIQAVPKNGGNRPKGVGPKCLDKVNGFSDVYGRLYWDRPSITLTRYARNPASGRYVHPEQDRGLSMREAASLQSYPKGFAFSGSFDSIFRQIGESVPPKLATGIASTVLSELVSPAPESENEDGFFPQVLEPVSSSYSSVIAGKKLNKDI